MIRLGGRTGRGLLALGLAVVVLVATAVAALLQVEGGGRLTAAPTTPPRAAGPDRSTPATHQSAPVAVPLLGAPTEAGSTVRTAAGGKQPNVVLVMMDDMRHDELRFAPNLQEHVVERGLVFQNSFSPYPLCCPARATFLTGKYAHNHGVLYIRNPLAFGAIDDRVTVASRLWDAGYRTAMVGKYLNRYGRARSRVTGKPSVRYVPHGWSDWMAALDPGWRLGELRGGGVYHYFDFTQNVNGAVTFNTGAYSSDVIGRQATALVDRYSDADAPFFLYLAPAAPHNGVPFEPDDPRAMRAADGTTTQVGTPARPDWVKGRFDVEIPKGHGIRSGGLPSEADVSDKPGPFLVLPEPTAQERRAVRDIARQRAESIFAWDRQFGRLVRELERTGEYDDTVFVWTSDNGYYNGEHRMREGKIWSHEVSLRVPLVVAGPGIQHGVRYAPATTADLTATVLELAQARPLPAMDGRSLLPAMVGADLPWTAPVLTEGLLTGIRRTVADFPEVLTTSGIRTGRWKYTRYADGSAELYDLLHDPNELTNVYRDPAFTHVRERLEQVWLRTRTCRDRGCRTPMPATLQVRPPRLAQISERAARAVADYYR